MYFFPGQSTAMSSLALSCLSTRIGYLWFRITHDNCPRNVHTFPGVKFHGDIFITNVYKHNSTVHSNKYFADCSPLTAWSITLDQACRVRVGLGVIIYTTINYSAQLHGEWQKFKGHVAMWCNRYMCYHTDHVIISNAHPLLVRSDNPSFSFSSMV